MFAYSVIFIVRLIDVYVYNIRNYLNSIIYTVTFEITWKIIFQKLFRSNVDAL